MESVRRLAADQPVRLTILDRSPVALAGVATLVFPFPAVFPAAMVEASEPGSVVLP